VIETESSGIRFGCQTYSWQMSGETYRGRLEHMAEVAGRSGFAGLEPEVVMLGERFAGDPAATGAVLAEHGLELAALTFVADWLGAQETEQERADADRFIDFVAQFPGTRLALVQMPGSAERTDLAVRQAHAIACANAVARRAAAAGVASTFHPNSPPGSVFRTAEDYEVLLDGLDPEVLGYTPDLGHIAAGGMDPLETVRRYRDRVDHIHYKDIDAAGAWAPTGAGVVDFEGVTAFLKDTAYSGWIVFEDEADATQRDPDDAARRNGVYVRDVLAPAVDAGAGGIA
jgi:inosose dehydratase